MKIFLNPQMCVELDLPYTDKTSRTYCRLIDDVRNVYVKWDLEMPTTFVVRDEFSLSRKKKSKFPRSEVLLSKMFEDGWFEIVSNDGD